MATILDGAGAWPGAATRRLTAVILAGGAGTRLRPLTHGRRKELMPIVNRPLLEHRLRSLRAYGITDVVFACTEARDLRGQFGDGAALGMRLSYHCEARPLGSGRAVKEAAKFVGARGTLVVCNGDIVSDVDLGSMMRRHLTTRALVSISLTPVDEPWHFGVVEADRELAIRRFVEKPPRGQEPGKLINAGTWLWEPDVLELIPDDGSAVVDGFAERVLFPQVIADGGRVQGFVEDFWFDVGTPERYLDANRGFLIRLCSLVGRSTLIANDARVADGVRVVGNCYVGSGAVIGRGVTLIGPCVVGDGVVLEDGARVSGSVIWPRARVGRAAVVVSSILGEAARLGDGTRIVAGVLADRSGVAASASPPKGTRLLPGEFWGSPGACIEGCKRRRTGLHPLR